MDMVGEKEGNQTRVAELLDVLNFSTTLVLKSNLKVCNTFFLIESHKNFFPKWRQDLVSYAAGPNGTLCKVYRHMN